MYNTFFLKFLSDFCFSSISVFNKFVCFESLTVWFTVFTTDGNLMFSYTFANIVKLTNPMYQTD